MRIAWVVNTFDIGGLERCVARLANGLDRERFQPMVICLRESGAAADWIECDDVEIVELKKRPGNDWRLVSRLAHTLLERKIDIVQSHNWGTLVETTLARRRACTPVHVHAERGTVLGDVNASGFRFRLRALAMRWALNRANAVMSNATSVANRVHEKCGYPASRIQIIPNGVERPFVSNAVAARREIRREMNIPESAFLVGSIGRLHPVKGFDIAIEAIHQLTRDGNDVHLLLVGDGPQEGPLRDLTKTLNLSNRVHFAGRRQDVGRWLAGMDVFFNSSHSEGMSQSLAEAMAGSLPLVVTDVGDNPALLGTDDPPCGLIIPPNDAAAMRKAIYRLAKSPELLVTMRQQAMKRYQEQFGVDRMLHAFSTLYLHHLREARPGSVRMQPTAAADE